VPYAEDAEEEIVLDRGFDASTLHVLREAVLAHATAAGMPEGRAVDVMLALHELAANAVRHGAGTGRLRIEVTASGLRCQVSDPGRASLDGHDAAGPAGAHHADATVSPAGPWPCRRGHGLWLVRETADQLNVSSGPGGSEVSVLFTLPGAGHLEGQ
jgi:anti-sigma regulatory factor (Ser/Thr protein kinase)